MPKLTVADYRKKNPALKRIAEMFEDAFNSVGEKIREDLLKAYRTHAKDYFDAFMRAAGTTDGEISPRNVRPRPFQGWSHYVKIDREGLAGSYSAYPHTWAEIRGLQGRLSVNYEEAEKNANYSYEHARDSFVYKNIGKVSNVLGDRQDLKNAVMKFDWKFNYFKGNLQVYLEGAYFRGDVDIKYVIRRIPNVTPYFQYPLVFTEAEIGGKHYSRPSEEELRMLLGAKKSAAEEKREQAVAAGICPMSGQSVPEALLKGLHNRMMIYVKCPGCGAVASVNKQSWKFRNHKTPGAERAGAAKKLETAGYCPMSRQKVPAEIVASMGPVEPYKDPKALCQFCGQQVRLDARKEWIRDQYLTPDGLSTKMKVESAIYYKHKLLK